MMTGNASRTEAGRGATALILLFAIGAALRVLSLDVRSFWLDEATSVRQASWPIPEMLDRMANNVHPPLFHYLLHQWIDVFGSTEVAVRSYALAWGLLAIPLVWFVTAAIYDTRSAAFATGVVALLPVLIWYSQEARMYTMLLVFAIIATGAMWKALRTGRARWWATYAVACALGLMTQYFFSVLMIGQAVYMLFFEVADRVRQRRAERGGQQETKWPRALVNAPIPWGWLASLAFAAIPLAVWIPRVLSHRDLLARAGGSFNYGTPPPAFGAHESLQLLVPTEWIFGFHSEAVMRGLSAMWPLLITGAFVIGGLSKKLRPESRYLAVSGTVAAATLSVLGMWQPIVLEVRYFTAAAVPLMILAGRMLAQLRAPAARTAVALALVISAVSYVDQSYNPDSVVKWDNREAFTEVSDEFRPGDSILLIPFFTSSIAQYYLSPDTYDAVQRVPTFGSHGNVRNSERELGEDLARQVSGARRVWLVATWQETPRIALDRENTDEWLRRNQYREVKDDQLHRIRVTLYERPELKQFFFSEKVGP